MKHLYILSLLVFISLRTLCQVYTTTWYETFESMAPNAAPSAGWLSNGTFSVLPAHGHTYITGNQGLSKRLYTNTGLGNVDSVFSPKITGFIKTTIIGSLHYRICNWAGGMPVSRTTLAAGDTCYISVCKYTGSAITSNTVCRKIYAGNHNQSDTNYLTYPMPYFLPASINWTDTFSIMLKVQRGSSGDYWYDFDDFIVSVPMGVHENMKSGIDAFPNPVVDVLKINSPNSEAPSSISIINPEGIIVKRIEKPEYAEQNYIPVGDLRPGLYFIEITLPNGLRTIEKIVKE